MTDRGHVTDWGSEPLEPGLVSDGLIIDPPKVASIIQALLESRQLTKSGVICSVAGIRSLPRILHLPRVERKILEDAINFESERQMPLPLSELYIARKHLGDSNSESRFFVVGMHKQHIDAQAHTLDLAGVKSYQLDLKSIALARAVHREEAVIINLEPWRSELVLMAGGLPLITRTLYIRSQEMTVEERIREVAVEVSRTLEFYNSNHPEHPQDQSTAVFLSGKLAGDPDVVELAKAAIGNPIEPLTTPFEHPDKFPVAEYATNLGLAMKDRETKASHDHAAFPALELAIVPDSHKTPRTRKKLLISSLVAALLMALVLFTYQLDLDGSVVSSDLRFEAENLEQRLQDASQTQESLDSIKLEISELNEETQVVLGPTGSFVKDLNSIFDDMPSGVTPTDMTITGDSITVEGTATTRSSAMGFVGLIEMTEKFSAVNIASLTAIENRSDGPIMQFTIIVER